VPETHETPKRLSPVGALELCKLQLVPSVVVTMGGAVSPVIAVGGNPPTATHVDVPGHETPKRPA
jgi:hypothetical protein